MASNFTLAKTSTLVTDPEELKRNHSHDSSLTLFSYYFNFSTHFISKGISHRLTTLFSFLFLTQRLISVKTKFSLLQKQFHTCSRIYFLFFSARRLISVKASFSFAQRESFLLILQLLFSLKVLCLSFLSLHSTLSLLLSYSIKILSIDNKTWQVF